ncbi:hypothetical protein DRQ09_07145, partial [candidate division KSB1 bacterium]
IIPEKYDLTIFSPNAKRNISVVFKDGKALLTDIFRGNKAEKEWVVNPGFEILDNNVIDHWYMVLKKFVCSDKDSAEITVVVPVLKRNFKIKVKKSEIKSIELENKKYESLKIDGILLSNNVKFSGWVNPEDGEIIKFSIPAQSFEMVLSDSIIPFMKKEPELNRGSIAESKKEKFPFERVIFGIDRWKLKGKLSFPAVKKKKYPALILVHGSGPLDEDETIGPNKPFRDIAEGLNQEGYAVFRYEKRTHAYGPLLDIKTLTVREETIDDAVEAVKYLSTRKDIDKKNIFLLGHSLGGFIAPYIAKKAKCLRGIIIAAGNTRSLKELVADQIKYRSLLSGLPEEDVRKKVDEVINQYESVLRSDYSELKLWIGLTRKYLEDLNSRNPVQELVKLDIPVLIIQGESDYQVTMKDFEGWKKGAINAGKRNVTFKSFPGLNHLFMKVKGKSTGMEYMIPGKVSDDVIKFIASWMNSIIQKE